MSTEGAFAAVGPKGTPAVTTLLLLDLVGSTRWLERVGDARANELFADHDRLARELLASYGGREIDKTDGFLLLFERPIEAVRFALEYHRRLAEMGRDGEIALAARAGIHLGEVFLRENPPAAVERGAKPLEVEGLAKHTAARIMALAAGSQTLLSRAAFDVARRADVGGEAAERVRWLAHGPYLFDGLRDPLEIFEVGLDGQAPLAAPADSPKARRAVAAGDEVTLGWRPAAGHELPGRPHWTLEGKLGEGGFGEVWLARHAKTGDRRVLKFCYQADRLRSLKREVTLFRLLRDALGERDDIARILDWNFDQPPFFLESEYTGGGDLAIWAEDQGGIDQVPLDVRVEIVAQVATALAAAHSVGVLHKDIKPSNVLITSAAGGAPLVRLTDFGIGYVSDPEKLAEHGITATSLTEVGLATTSTGAGSRLYMAPEVLEGKPPSVQSDIYSLGVVLFQVAVGDLRRALAPGWRREVDDELLAEDIALCVDGTPSQRLNSAHELAERLRNRARRQAERDEARLVAREAERARLALVRSQRRRRMSAVIIAVLVVVAAVMTLQNRRTLREAERANREAESARQVTDFLVGLFEVSAPDAALGETITAREILDRGVMRIETELAGQPSIRAELMSTMARVYHSLSLNAEARRLLESALEERRQLYGDEHPEVAECLFDLGRVLRAEGAYAEAEEALRAALDMRQRLLPEGDLAIVDSVRALGDLQLEVGDYSAARELYARALASLDGDEEAALRVRGQALNALAVLDEYTAPGEAGSAYEQALAVWRRLPAEEHTELASTLSNYGQWLNRQGRFGEAESALEQSLEIKRRLLGEDHPSVAFTLYKLADLLRATGEMGAAERHARDAVDRLRRELPGGHWRTARAESILGGILIAAGRLGEAHPILTAAYPVLRDARGPAAPPTVQTLERLVAASEGLGLDDEAADYRRLLAGSDG